MPKKEAYATVAEFQDARSEIAELRALSEKNEKNTEAMKKENTALKTEIKQLQDASQKLASLAGLERVAADSKAFVENAEKAIDQKLQKTATLSHLKNAEGGLETKINTVDAAWRSALADELVRLSEDLGKELETLKAEVSEGVEAYARQAAEALVDQRKELGATVEEARVAATSNDDAIKTHLDQEIARLKAELAETFKKQDERDKLQEQANQEALDKLDFFVKESTAATLEESGKRTSNVEKGLSSFQTDAVSRLEKMESDFKTFRDAVAEVENLSTRRVDWVIRNASKRLQAATEKAALHTSWFSPKFNAAGIHGLQLEFQLFRRADPPVEDELSGDCAVYLWASRGANLVFRLHVGSKNATLEKVFNGRVPYGTKRLCFLRDQINPEDDTLRVSVEILEAVREVEHQVNLPPPVEDCELAKLKNEYAAKTLEGVVQFRRHVNNRLFDQVKQQVELMQSRMVRRIEWRLENASILKRCFPQGEPICSTTFNAAAIEGMQLVFYPSGYGGCNDGFCSLFLYAPAGATLRCTLCAGGQRREAHHTFEDAGAFGRTNYCRYESTVDEETDSILIALEVDEAHQDVQATIAHPTIKPGDRRSQAELDGSMPKAVNSVVKMQRVPGQNPKGLNSSMVLPSLWTAKSLGDQLTPSDGLHSFDELRAQARGAGRRGGPNMTTGELSTTLSKRSESVPVLAATDGSFGRAAGQSDPVIPLPQLAKADRLGMSLGGSMGGSLGGGKSRKQRLF